MLTEGQIRYRRYKESYRKYHIKHKEQLNLKARERYYASRGKDISNASDQVRFSRAFILTVEDKNDKYKWREYMRTWRARNREKTKEAAIRAYCKKHGITLIKDQL